MNSAPRPRSRRRFRRALVALIAAMLVTFGLAAPASAQQKPGPDIDNIVDGIKSGLSQNSAEAQQFLDSLRPEAQARLQEIRNHARAGNWAEVRRLGEQLHVDAECAAFEFDLDFLPNSANFSSLTIDKEARVARAEVTVPEGCHLDRAVPVTLVSWVLDMAQAWGTSPQGRVDITDTVWIQAPGVYNLEVALPVPKLDEDAIAATLERDGLGILTDGDDGRSQVAPALDLDGVIDVFLSNPELLELVLGLVCPFQVDLVTAEASDVPSQLGGVNGPNPVTASPDSVSVNTLIHGAVGEWDSATQFSPIPDFTEGKINFDESLDDPLQQTAAEDPDVAGLLDSIPFELLCSEDPDDDTDVGGEQITNTGADSGADVAVAGSTLPRTGSETPGVLAAGVALIVAGWLVLVGNAVFRTRHRRHGAA